LAPSASLVYSGVFLGITSVSFWVEDRMGLAPPVYNVIRFSRYPVTIFGAPVRIFLTFVLPFAWVAFYPATWFLGSPEFHRWALFTPLVGLIVFGGAIMIWRRGVSNYASTGS
jgi:viologen exporter family transport system permease protein